MNQHDRARAIRRDHRLSWRERVILCELSDCQGDNESGYRSLTKIAKDLGINRSNFYRILGDLERRGWIRRSKNEDGKPAFTVLVPDAEVVSPRHQSSVATTPRNGVTTTPPVVSPRHSEGVISTPEKCHSDTSSFNAQERPRTTSERVAGAREAAPPPAESPPARPRPHAADFVGQPAEQARAALNVALRAAGHSPKSRGGWNAQTAWQQVACDAAELAEATGRDVAHVLEVSAAGFVAAKGRVCRPEWWAEDVAGYYDSGIKGAPRRRGEMAPIGVGFVGTTEAELDAMFGPAREVVA